MSDLQKIYDELAAEWHGSTWNALTNEQQTKIESTVKRVLRWYLVMSDIEADVAVRFLTNEY